MPPFPSKHHCPTCKKTTKSMSKAGHCKKHQWVCDSHKGKGKPWVMLWGEECEKCKVKGDCGICKTNEHPRSAEFTSTYEAKVEIPESVEFTSTSPDIMTSFDEAKVEMMVKSFINTFKRNPDLWLNFQNVVDELSGELPITPKSDKSGKNASMTRPPNELGVEKKGNPSKDESC